MAVLLSPLGGAAAQFFDSNGNPLAGGQVFTYQAGTSTPQATYTTSAGNIQHSNPIILDAAGRVPTGEIWLTDGVSYKFVTKNVNNVLIGTYDNIKGINPQLYAQDILYTYPATNAVQETVKNRLAQYVSVKDFGAVGDGVTDDSDAIQNALASNRAIYFPSGTYIVSKKIQVGNLSNFKLFGDGAGVSIIKANQTAVFNQHMFNVDTCSNFEVCGLTFNQNNNANFTGAWPVFAAFYCSYFKIYNCSFINLTYIGLSIYRGLDFLIENNYLEHNTAVNSTNYNINVTGTTTLPSRRGVIRNNILQRSANIFAGRDLIIDGNIALNCKYGAGITTGGDNSLIYGNYTVINNICNNGTGVDVDNVNVAGMEIGGDGVLVANNICNQNGGTGIAVLARNSIIANNECRGNGQNAGATDQYKSGILMSYADATVGAYYSNVIGNRCADDGSGSQKYGYYEEGTLLNNIALSSNNFAANTVAETYIPVTSNGFYQTNVWETWTPTITTASGSITTLGTVVAKYRRESKTVFFKISIPITTNGTGSGNIKFTLPPTYGGAVDNQVCYGRDNGVSGKMLVGIILAGTAGVDVTNYDGTYPGANGAVITVQGFYENP